MIVDPFILFILEFIRLVLRLILDELLPVLNFWDCIPRNVFACGEEVLLKSVSFWRDFDREDVLNTDRSSPFTSFEPFLLSVCSLWLCLDVSSPYKSCYILKSTELLKVTTEASLADFFTGSCTYFSKTPNFGTWVKHKTGSYLGIPHLGFINGCDKIC